ncbi:MAG: HTH-type transcriptional regulator betI [Aeromicrobium sp.]|jgi:AcrR family transcriptional regulator|nr:HTH-type transcriptional regulator betI [Aeromicrobium sp.]
MATMTPDTSTLAKPTARERLLAAADELFYDEGIHTVGIDRIIEHAGVAKASLYNTFGSKDELVRAYLTGRHESRQRRITTRLEDYDTPRAKLLGVFDSLRDYVALPTFRGCAFANASAESQPGGVVDEVSTSNRTWTRDLLTDLAREAGVADPDALAQQLILIYDGAITGVRMDHRADIGAAARATAEILVDRALAS